jgi:hypothetical protein
LPYFLKKGIINNFAEISASLFANNPRTPKATTNSVVVGENACAITYHIGDLERQIFLPYYRHWAKYVDIGVFLVVDNCRHSIRHQLGIPYFANAKMLGGNSIILTYQERELDIGPDEIPNETHFDSLFS